MVTKSSEDVLKGQIARLKADKIYYNLKIGELNSKISDLKKQKDDIQVKIQELENILVDLQSDIAITS